MDGLTNPPFSVSPDDVLTITDMPEPPTAAAPAHRRFHAAVASEVIEHVESPPAFLQALAGAVSQVCACEVQCAV